MSPSEISRRRFMGAAAAGLVASQIDTPSLAETRRPNILFVTMDEHRHDAMGCAGNQYIKTPSLDALASRGALFTHTYTQGPLCQPARASLMTGQYVKQHGQSWNGFAMKPEWPTMMKALQSAGYTTAMVGKTHFYASAYLLGINGNFSKPTFDAKGQKIVDMRANLPWSRQFGLDHLMEEFDHLLHKRPNIVTPYTEYLAAKGLLETYRSQLPDAEYGGVGQVGLTSTIPAEDQLSSFVGDSAIDWLKNYKSEKPFFLWVSFIEPHPPIMNAEKWNGLYKDIEIPTGTRQLPDMPNNAWGDYLKKWVNITKSAEMTDAGALQMAQHYYSLVSQVDQKLGEVVKALDESGKARDTWIFYTSDHGEMLGHHNLVFKLVFYDGAVRVPNIILPPGGISARTISNPVESIDVTATMLDVAGAKLPTCEGRSLLPLMTGSGTPRNAVYSELAGFNNKDNFFVMAATDQYRYLYDKENRIACELFDLKNDPGEMQNLVADADHANTMRELHDAYIAPFIAA